MAGIDGGVPVDPADKNKEAGKVKEAELAALAVYNAEAKRWQRFRSNPVRCPPHILSKMVGPQWKKLWFEKGEVEGDTWGELVITRAKSITDTDSAKDLKMDIIISISWVKVTTQPIINARSFFCRARNHLGVFGIEKPQAR